MKNYEGITKNKCMSKKLQQKVIAATLASLTIIPYGSSLNVYADDNKKESISYAYNYENAVTILNSYGDLENTAIEWKSVQNADGYNVYYKKSEESNSQYKQIDNMLIRQYPSYNRADIPGITEGKYDIKVVPIFNGI